MSLPRPISGKPPVGPAVQPRPIAPTSEQWAAMGLEQRRRFLEEVLAALSAPRAEARRAEAEARRAEAEARRAQDWREVAQGGVLLLLTARQLPVPEAVRAAILACEDRQTLALWQRRAATAAAAEDILKE